MQKLEVFANRRAANGGFWFFGALIPLLSIPIPIFVLELANALLSLSVKQIAENVVGMGVFGWLLSSLSRYWWQFRRIRTLEGPLFVLSSSGVTDHWRQPSVFVSWQDLECAEWQAKGGWTHLQFNVKSRSWLERYIGTLGFRPFQYPVIYMDHDLVEIGEFIDRHFPPQE